MTAIHTGGRKYSVVLVDVGSGTDVYLHEVLLERNLALPDNIEQILEKLAPVLYEVMTNLRKVMWRVKILYGRKEVLNL